MEKTSSPLKKEQRQQHTGYRFTLKGIFISWWESITEIDRNLWLNTMWALTISPGKSLRTYLGGFSFYLVPAGSYLALCGTLAAVLSARYSFYAMSDSSLIQVIHWGPFSEWYRLLNIAEFLKYAEEHPILINIITIPIFSLCSYLALHDLKLNTGEHVIINVYIAAHQLLFLLVLVPFLEWWPKWHNPIISIYTLVVILYNIGVYAQLYAKPTILSWTKSIFAVVLAYVLQAPFNYISFQLLKPFIKIIDPLL
jgi:hypothetical protein